MYTIKSVLDQVAETAKTCGMRTKAEKWDVAYSTYCCAAEDGEEMPFTLYQLEEHFEKRFSKKTRSN